MSKYSRVLQNGKNKITWNYVGHCNNHKANAGSPCGTDVIAEGTTVDNIVAHTKGTVIKVVNYLNGTNGKCDNEGMGYGNMVAILHNSKSKGYLVTVYCHLAYVNGNIKEGASIKKGTVIGQMGWTGNTYPANSGGTHLHFELRNYPKKPIVGMWMGWSDTVEQYKFDWLNPEPYLNADLPTIAEPKPKEDYSKSTIPERFKVVDKNGKQLASYTNYNYALNFAKSVNGIILDSANNNKQIYPE